MLKCKCQRNFRYITSCIFCSQNGLTPLHLCAQEDKVNVAAVLVKNRAEIDPTTKVCLFPIFFMHTGRLIRWLFLVTSIFYPFLVPVRQAFDRPAGVDRPSSYHVIHVYGAQPWKLIFLHNLHTFLKQILCLKVGGYYEKMYMRNSVIFIFF
jgi:Ankyrin repeat.